MTGEPAMTGWWEARAGLSGTVAVITGGAGGLGAAITRDLAANGVRVAVLDIDQEAVADIRRDLAQDPAPGFGRDPSAEPIVRHGDARDPDELAALFAAVDDQWGRLDILVNVPGGTFRAPFTETRPKGWDALIRMNLTHVLHACSLAVPRMQAGGRGGSIVNLTTIECHRAAPGYAVYSAAKAGVEQFARSLAVELAPDNIRVNNVAPDYTPTPNMTRLAGTGANNGASNGTANGAGAAANPGAPAPSGISIPMARPGIVTDVSNAVLFLASGLSSYMTGQTLHPDGGTYASAGWFNWPAHGWQNNVPGDVYRLLPDN